MSIDFYYTPMSSPCRAVLLTAEAIGLTLNLKEIDLMAGEHRKPEYQEICPRMVVPYLVDGDYTLTESRAIMSYLVDRYGSNVRLNPRTAQARALVSQRLYFDIGTLYRRVADYYYPAIFGTTGNQDRKPLEEAFEMLDKLLEGQEYVAGRSLTIADLALAATVSTAEVMGFELEWYKNVARWMDRMKTSAPGYRKANGEGLEALKKYLPNQE